MHRVLMLTTILLATAPGVGCNESVITDDQPTDLRGARHDDLGFDTDPDLAHDEDLAEPDDLSPLPDLRLVPLALSFAAPVGYATDNMPDSIVAADFNRDNRVDLAVATHGGAGLAVLLGAGNGTFAAPVTYEVGGLGYGLAAGDLNGDTKMDLCVSNPGAHWLRTLLGKGDGTFDVLPDKFAAPYDPYGLAVGDFNGDKKLDVAAVQRGMQATVIFYPGNGDGTLGAYQKVSKETIGQYLAAGDMDADGILDLVVPDLNRQVMVLRGDGKGGFTEHATYEAGDGPYGVGLADLTGDGKKDVVISNERGMPSAVRVLKGMGKGYLLPAFPYPTKGKQTWDLTLADFDNDRLLDVAVVDVGSSTVVLMRGLGDGTLGEVTAFPCGAGPRSLAAADFNRDGRMDLAITAAIENRVMVMLNTSR